MGSALKETCTPNLIVGGGPAGLVLGIELASRGVPCILVNEGKTTPNHPQGNTQSARTMEHYRRLGIVERIRNAGLPIATEKPRQTASDPADGLLFRYGEVLSGCPVYSV